MTRKKSDVQLTWLDKILEIIALVVLLGMVVFVAFNFGNLPEEYPVHFDESGVPNSFATPWSVMNYLLIALAIYVVLSLASRFPHKFFYPVKINDQNRIPLYAMALRALRVIKLLLIAMYAYLTYSQIAMLTMNQTPDRQALYFIAVAILMIPPLVVVKMINLKIPK